MNDRYSGDITQRLNHHLDKVIFFFLNSHHSEWKAFHCG